MFKETLLDANAFGLITTDSHISGAYSSGTAPSPASRATGLQPGDVVAFQTEAGKQGLILVKSISGTTDGTITLDVKVQK